MRIAGLLTVYRTKEENDLTRDVWWAGIISGVLGGLLDGDGIIDGVVDDIDPEVFDEFFLDE